MKRLSFILPVLAGLFFFVEMAQGSGKHVLFLAGKDSHGWGAHLHVAGSNLLSELLPEGAPALTSQVVREWPSAELLDKADALVIYADGWHLHPANGHLEELKAFMNAGKGLVVFHWATGIGPKAGKGQQEDPSRVEWRQLVGADFEPFHSISNFFTADFERPSKHPVMNGVPPFKLHDECYFHLRECVDEHGEIERVLPVHPPAETIQKGVSAFRGNNAARAAIQEKKEQFCGWTFERPDGGRAFGFTGGHFHWNWARDEVRKMALNGIVWAAGGRVPEKGVETSRPTAARMLEDMSSENPGWTEVALQQALDLAQSGTPVEWGKFSKGALPVVAEGKGVSLFDGKTLDGWVSTEGVWRVEDGAITGGSHERKFPRNEFISTGKSYANFDLSLKIKCSGDPATGLINSGIQIRSARLPNGRLAGYQIDCGDEWFGKIYDEHRRALIYPEPIDEPKLLAGIDTFGWNDYRILAEGPRIQVWINGIQASDYTETNPLIPLDGVIAPQVHSGGKVMVQFKDVFIRELPPTPGAPTWESLGGTEAALKKVKQPRKANSRRPNPPKKEAPAKKTDTTTGAKKAGGHNDVEGDPRTAAEQAKLFHLPEGYEIELVVQESEGIGKFVSVYFDQRGRLWTQTALEYPVDGNQNAAAAEALYKTKAKDKVLVYPREALAEIPEGGLSDPTVFADGLAIPLGILPWGNGDSAYVLNGPDLFLLTDRDGDGKADEREVILTGFGVQDSHLLPHQFTRVPGDWIWMAQGLFNNSAVKQPGSDDVIDWPKCSMARMRPDGGEFEITSTGPNNIWGLAFTGEGETFIQEANDYGYPAMAFHDYAYYPGGMKGLKKSYQPSFPPAAEFRMGGTGLSGLALLENGPLRDDEADLSMLVANPIISKVQTLAIKRDGSYWDLERLGDLVTCDDPYFRPVGLTQGPDGFLYIVDWYNKIISHNEVPRNHPERDKTRGRIWRIKPASADKSVEIPDFTQLSNSELVAMLGMEPTARAHIAWQTLADRNDPEVVKTLQEDLVTGSLSGATAIQALWVLGDAAVSVGEKLLSSENRNLRRELASYPALAAELLDDPDANVRFAALTTLGRQLPAGVDEILPLMLASVKPRLVGPTEVDSRTKEIIPSKEAYDREFERFLVRFFLEGIPREVAALLNSDAARELSLEGRILAALALPPKTGAPLIAALLPDLDRAPDAEELFRLAEFPDVPDCGEALAALLAKEDSRAEVAAQLLSQKTRLDPKKIAPLLTQASRALLAGGGEAATIGLELAGAYSLNDLEPEILAFIGDSSQPQADRLTALTALRQMRSRQTDLLVSLAASSEEDSVIREGALAALAASAAPDAPAKVIGLYPDLDPGQRRLVLAALSSTKLGARALVTAFENEEIPEGDLDSSTAERLATVLEGDPALAVLMDSLDQVFGKVLKLAGKPSSFAATNLELDGPFTIESWVRLDPNIGSEDSLLGAKNVRNALDLNFHQSRLHVWVGQGVGNAVVSTKPMAPDLWTHLAITRNAQGVIRIYTDGELDAESESKVVGKFSNLNVGFSTPPRKGTSGSLAEFRVWSRERSAQEIRQYFDRSFSGSSRPNDLVFYNSGGEPSWGELGTGASVSQTTDLPPLLTLDQAEALDAKFAKYMALGRKGGNPENGKLLSALCTSCHVIDGQGGQIGPELSGAAEMGLEGVLRNILTPNAAMESGYRIYRVELKSGEIIDAFFVSEDKSAVVIRQIGLSDRRIPKSEIASTRFIRRSLMPEGLLDALNDEQVADLLAYLMKKEAP
ncbi:PVC-type heme-binding CxxCH protein [Haloferula chungangensis]|uniref:PVC-type heme-binding CxxCH protein n=1 Tax=Haloferula chungangensis TaxID=1048331 RepID=A0ABW2LBL4_9BACT